MISARNLYFSYGRKQVLFDLSLEIAEGEVVALMGKSGCGKTTFLRLLAGFANPTKGQLLIRDKAVRKYSDDHQISVVFQHYGNIDWLSAEENVSIALSHIHCRDERDRTARRRLEEVGLAEARTSYVREMSGGMRQRLAFARAIAQPSELMLLDEPFASVDADTRGELIQTLKSLLRVHSRTVVMVTHSLSDAELLADRIVDFAPFNAEPVR